MLRDATKDLKVRIMVVLRRQDEFIQSLYTQVIHRGEKIEHSINEFLGTFDWEQLKWTHFLKPLQQYFGPENVDIYPYDPYVFQKYTIVELLNHSVGSSVLAALSNVKTDNIGYSSNGIEIANRLNDALNVEQRQILRACLQKTSNKGLYHEYNLLEPSLKKELISFYSEDNHELFQKYFQSRFGMVNYSDPNFDSSTRPIADDYDDLIVTLLHEIEKNKYSNNLFLDFLRRLKKKIVK
jgi:hypothetical protein